MSVYPSIERRQRLFYTNENVILCALSNIQERANMCSTLTTWYFFTFFSISLNFKAYLDECTALKRHLQRRNCARIKLHSKQFSMTISWYWNITLSAQECFETVLEYGFVRRLLRFSANDTLILFHWRQFFNPFKTSYLSDILLNHFHEEEFICFTCTTKNNHNFSSK